MEILMECFVTKLNVEPTVLELYDENNLIKEVIPNSFDRVFERIDEKENIIKYRKKDDIQLVLDSDLYQQMLDYKKILIEEYENVVLQYQKTREIIYREQYMEKRSALNEAITELFELHPFLKNSEKIRINSFSKGKIPEVRMGMTYIDRASKIESFLATYTMNDRILEFYYDRNSERIYIPSSIVHDRNIMRGLQSIIDELTTEINLFRDITDIGKVSINPIFENFQVKVGRYSEVTITRVYPNGDPARDRGRAIVAFNAAKEETKYTAPEGEKINSKDIEDYTREDAELGYIASIFSRTKNIIENTIKKIFIKF